MKIERIKEYILRGEVVVWMWSGGNGFARVEIFTNKQGYEEIKKHPLQDYLQFGVKDVKYVNFDVYEKEIITTPYNKITIENLVPFDHIEAGEYDLTEEEEEALVGMDFVNVNYYFD